MAEVDAMPLVEVPSSVAVIDDLACRKCQYNLRSLSGDAMCPECGTPVAYSLRSDQIQHSDPGWIERLTRGVHIIVWGIFLLAAASVFRAVNGNSLNLDRRLPPMGIFFSYGVIVTGVWFLTTADPGGLGESSYGTMRKVARYGSVIGLGDNLWMAIVWDSALSPEVFQVCNLAAMVLGICGWIAFMARLTYLSRLAERIPSLELQSQAVWLRLKLGAPLLILYVALWTRRFLWLHALLGSHRGLIALVGGVSTLMVALFGIGYLKLLDRFRSELNLQAELARKEWTAAGD